MKEDSTYTISFAARNWIETETCGDVLKANFVASTEPNGEGIREEIGSFSLKTNDLGWTLIELAEWWPTINYEYLSIQYDNSIDTDSFCTKYIELDDICIQLIPNENTSCCENDSLFTSQVNQGFEFTILGCDIEVRPRALDSCIQVEWNWGDGTNSELLAVQQAARHTYSDAGPFIICMTASVKENGKNCFANQFCDTLSFGCVPVPACCMGFSNFIFTDGLYEYGETDCGNHTTIIYCDLGEEDFQVQGNFDCIDQCQTDSVSYEIFYQTDSINILGNASIADGVFSIPLGKYGFYQAGQYKISLSGTCDGNTCEACTWAQLRFGTKIIKK